MFTCIVFFGSKSVDGNRHIHYFIIFIVDYLHDRYGQFEFGSKGPGATSSVWCGFNGETVDFLWSWDVVANRELNKEKNSLDTQLFFCFSPRHDIFDYTKEPQKRKKKKSTVRSLPYHETNISPKSGDRPQNVTRLQIKSIFSHERKSFIL